MKCYILRSSFSLLITLAFGTVVNVSAQVSPEEHARHHPGSATKESPRSDAAVPNKGGMMEMMDRSKSTEIYPRLMALPNLSTAQQRQVEEAARQRMVAGTALLSEGLTELTSAAASDEFTSMEGAIAKMRQALAQFDSGIAAQRAIREGTSPRNVAMEWFKREMNLAPPSVPPRGQVFGISLFHAIVMAGLTLFAVTMISMYFFKMRRATALLRALVGSEPTVSSPAPHSLRDVSQKSQDETSAREMISLPPERKWSGVLRIGRVFQETPNVKTFRLVSSIGGELPFSFLPGQFLTVTVPTGGGAVKRSYTIASSPTQHDYAELTVKHEEGGIVSGFLHSNVSEGNLVQCSGPTGSFIFTGRECKCILLIGGGVGITPLMSVLRSLLDRSWAGDIFLIYSCRTPADIIFKEEFDYLQHRHKNLRVLITVSRPEGTPWSGSVGRITKDLITKFVADLPSRYVHICGPVPMMEATTEILAQLGVPRGRIKVEAFGPAVGKVERVRAPKPHPTTSAKQPDSDVVALPTVTFSKSHKSALLPPDKVILDVAEDNGVDIDYSCRVGVCGVCRVKLTSGQVTMAVQDGLQPGDKESGVILACQAKSQNDAVVEA